MKYIPPFSLVMSRFKLESSSTGLLASIQFNQLENLIRLILMSIDVDEVWYRDNYPDVNEAIESGNIESAKAHFVRNGYFEGRRPFRMLVDSDWYVEAYSDIAQAVKSGEIASSQEHFEQYGYAEGRLPARVFE